MWELISSGGWLMLPIILSSVIAVAIVIERLWALRSGRKASRAAQFAHALQAPDQHPAQ